MKNSDPRQILISIISDKGNTILDRPQDLLALFNDLSEGKFKKEFNGISRSLREGIPFDMLKQKNMLPNEIPYEIYAPRFCKCLQEKYGLTEELAIWTIESWAFAFGILKDELLDLKVEIETFYRSKHLWERGQLPWYWWSTIGMNKQSELTNKIEEIHRKKEQLKKNKFPRF